MDISRAEVCAPFGLHHVACTHENDEEFELADQVGKKRTEGSREQKVSEGQKVNLRLTNL